MNRSVTGRCELCIVIMICIIRNSYKLREKKRFETNTTTKTTTVPAENNNKQATRTTTTQSTKQHYPTWLSALYLININNLEIVNECGIEWYKILKSLNKDKLRKWSVTGLLDLILRSPLGKVTFSKIS